VRPAVRRWLIGGGLAVLGLGLVVAIAGYLLVGHRPSIAPAPPVSRTEPDLDRLPALSACWIESAEAFGSTASAILVRHPAGDLLIDAGASSRLHDEVADYDFGDRFWFEQLPGRLVPERPLPELLRAAGVEPTAVRILLSHAHLDHAGGLMDMPPVPVLMAQAEIDFVTRLAEAGDFHVIPAQARRLLEGGMTAIELGPEPYEIYPASADLFGDGSVVVVSLAGHTPGSVGVFVNLPGGRRLFHVGDAVNDEEAFEERVGRSRIMRRTDVDRARADHVVAELHQLHRLVPDLAIIPAHGRPAYQRFFGAPSRCVP
jgi:N-acyl homoserine lactone hydrolase